MDRRFDEADRYSAEAHKNLPCVAPIRRTRGSVLIELGQVEEGLELLRSSLEKTDTPKEKASTMCYIAIGEARRRQSGRSAALCAGSLRLLDPDVHF